MSLDLSLVHQEDHDGREEETFACSDAATQGWGEPVEPKLSCCRWSRSNWQGPSTSSPSSTIPQIVPFYCAKDVSPHPWWPFDLHLFDACCIIRRSTENPVVKHQNELLFSGPDPRIWSWEHTKTLLSVLSVLILWSLMKLYEIVWNCMKLWYLKIQWKLLIQA